MNIPEAVRLVMMVKETKPILLAKKLNMSRSYLSEMINENKPFKLKFLIKFCNAHDIKMSKLFRLAEVIGWKGDEVPMEQKLKTYLNVM